jgi:AAA15 family ATPase/GTPase
MRVTKLRVSNFKRFADATFDLRPFNVIVGPNNSGKSQGSRPSVLAKLAQ